MESGGDEGWGLGWGWEKPSQRGWGPKRVLQQSIAKQGEGAFCISEARHVEHQRWCGMWTPKQRECRGQLRGPWIQWWQTWLYPLSEGGTSEGNVEGISPWLQVRGGLETKGSCNIMYWSVDENVTRDSEEPNHVFPVGAIIQCVNSVFPVTLWNTSITNNENALYGSS